MQNRTRAFIIVVAIVGGILVAPAAAQAAVVPTTVAVAGDSTTAQKNSWAYQINSLHDARIKFAGGYFGLGFNSKQVLSHIPPSRPDVLIVKLGTNDIAQGVRLSTVIANVKAIVAKVGPKHVILSAIVPSNLNSYGRTHIDRAALGAQLNRALLATAKQFGWTYLDPDATFRTVYNRYRSGYTKDGTHPNTAGYRAESVVFRRVIIDRRNG
jgi:hypothetical protein